jgi:hypothetical protein
MLLENKLGILSVNKCNIIIISPIRYHMFLSLYYDAEVFQFSWTNISVHSHFLGSICVLLPCTCFASLDECHITGVAN